MQLLLCSECRDLVKLIWRSRSCSCGACSGLIVERGDRQVGHFAGPAVPMEAADLSVQSVLRNRLGAGGAPVRLLLQVVTPESVAAEATPSMLTGRRYQPRKHKRRLPKRARPYHRKRR